VCTEDGRRRRCPYADIYIYIISFVVYTSRKPCKDRMYPAHIYARRLACPWRNSGVVMINAVE